MGIIAKTARRIAVALTISIGVGLLLMTHWKSPPSSIFLRTTILGLSATAAFALFESWPRRLLRWVQRWVLQVVAVGVFMPVTTLLIYVLSTGRGAPPFWEVSDRITGWMMFALLLAPWTALAAIVREKEAFARDQELAFALERSELERGARRAFASAAGAGGPAFPLRHTRERAGARRWGSPHASTVLRSLVAYLRA